MVFLRGCDVTFVSLREGALWSTFDRDKTDGCPCPVRVRGRRRRGKRRGEREHPQRRFYFFWHFSFLLHPSPLYTLTLSTEQITNHTLSTFVTSFSHTKHSLNNTYTHHSHFRYYSFKTSRQGVEKYSFIVDNYTRRLPLLVSAQQKKKIWSKLSAGETHTPHDD